jgi:Asp-tRNA(Asn)/Glu-tRNA(Gln) amidotransferase A subunit family amidase
MTAPITLDAIAAAETVAGVAYTDAERALMLDGVQAQVELALRRRQVALPWDLGPAQRFDPRLPGFAMPEQGPFRWEPREPPLPGDDGIAFASLASLAGWIRAGRITATRLTRLYLDRIERLNPRLLCFAAVLPDAALAEAEAMDALLSRGTWLGPLHGIPYGMKDILDTAGVETSWGAETYRGRVPEEDAFVTARLREAGAVLLGKTTVGALAYGDIWHGGRTRNPWNLDEGSSGSSAGSASATVAGLAGFAVGTETLGSIVSPSARCGAAGLRPTYGRVSRRGAMPLCWSLDKVGAIGRFAEDTAPVLAAMGAPDPLDAFQLPAPFGYDPGLPLAGLRLGYYEEDLADPLDRAALEAARTLGLAPVALPRRPLPYDALRAVLYAEAAASFEELTLSDRDDELAWQDADAWPSGFRRARFLSAVDHVQLDRLRRLVMEETAAAFRGVALILGPSLAGPMTLITNFTGHPCLTLRAGFRLSPTRGRVSLLPPSLPQEGADGPPSRVPHTVSLWGRLFEEGVLVAAGRALEAALGAAGERPLL